MLGIAFEAITDDHGTLGQDDVEMGRLSGSTSASAQMALGLSCFGPSAAPIGQAPAWMEPRSAHKLAWRRLGLPSPRRLPSTLCTHAFLDSMRMEHPPPRSLGRS